jgi:peroxiredoxin
MFVTKMTKKLILGILILLIVSVIAFMQLSTSSNRIEITDKSVGISIGKIAPDFELTDINGNSVKLSDHRGKGILLNFWATWCPPCREEMPEFQKIEEAGEIVILGVNLQEKPETIRAFAESLEITFPLLLDPDSTVKDTFNVFTQPVSYFIDGDGKIVDKKFGPLTEQEIEEKTSKIK